MNGSDQITEMLMILLMIFIFVLFILVGVFLIIKLKSKQKTKTNTFEVKENIESTNKSTIEQNYNVQSIYKFMEFDKIEDNMIIQKNGKKYLMVIGCQGINYDLMSREEKISVEEGFLQFLNTLRHPIQLYMQTRTVNLEDSIATYKSKVKEYEDKLNKMKFEYEAMMKSGSYSKEELNKYFFEITKQTNLCEYGKDIIFNTEKMNKNKNILNKQYYIVVPYYPEDIGNSKLDNDEIKNIAFSELYTRCQSLIRALGVCGVSSRILYSNELTELLHIAYNRDEAEIFSAEKALRSGYEELYSTAKDVLDKKMEALNKRVEEEALELANRKIFEVKSEKEKRVKEKEDNLDDLISQMAELIIQENSSYVGEEVAAQAILEIEEEKTAKKTKKKGSGVEDAKEKTKKTVRRTRTKTANAK